MLIKAVEASKVVLQTGRNKGAEGDGKEASKAVDVKGLRCDVLFSQALACIQCY